MDTKSFPNTQPNLQQVAATLKKGGVAIFPTDTVYDLGASIKHPEAFNRIFSIKDRPKDQSLPLLISRPEVALEIAEFKETNLDVLKKIWPGPWTIINKARVKLPAGLVGADGTVALRCPDHGLALEILREAGDTIAVSSANYSGGKSPIRFDEVPREFLDQVDAALDAGTCPLGGETAIARIEGKRLRIIRSGCVSKEEVSRVENLLSQMIQS